MKKYFLLAAAAATVLAVSCAKEKNQPTTDPTPTEIEDNTPQPIRFGTNIAEVKAPITKAAIENTGWGANQQLYVYAFRQTNGVPTITDAGVYIDNSPAEAPATFTHDGVRESISVWQNVNRPYYYENNVVYSFYGYYLGNATKAPGDPQIANNAVTATVTIDGTHDIMLADTDKFDDYLYAKAQAQAQNPASDVTVSIEKVYSEVSARQGVVPDLKFKHQLARFKFETKYGGNGTNTDITIKKIQMMSIKEGTLTIASANGQSFVPTAATWPTPDDAPGDDGKYGFVAEGEGVNSFTLKKADGTVAEGNPGDGVFAPIGESIMTFPQGLTNNASPKYHLLLTLTQTGRLTPDPTDDPAALEEFYVPMDIDFSKVVDAAGDPIINKYAEAGKMYVIRLVIYGSEQIEMTVSLEDWEYGGETQVDPDQDNRPEPTITISAPNPASFDLNLSNNTTGTITATAKYTPIGGTSPTDDVNITDINYGTSNKKVATVSVESSVVTVKAEGAGTCKIYVYVNGTNNYKGALATIDVTVTGGIAVPDPAPTVTASIVDTATPTPNALSEWNFQQTNVTQIGTISGSATVGGTPVATGGWSYEVEENDYFTVAANGAISTKDLSTVSDPGQDVVVTFKAKLAASAGNYAAGENTATITVKTQNP